MNFFLRKKLVLDTPDAKVKTAFENMHQKPYNLHSKSPVNHLSSPLLHSYQACLVTKILTFYMTINVNTRWQH